MNIDKRISPISQFIFINFMFNNNNFLNITSFSFLMYLNKIIYIFF